MTGGNISLGKTLARRSIWIRINANMARPWKRPAKQFKIPNLDEWLSNNSELLATALLILVRYWVVLGKPIIDDLPSMGDFQGWVNVVGSILGTVGINGFMENTQEFLEKVDADNNAMDLFIQHWYEEVFHDKEVTVSEVCAACDADNATRFKGGQQGIKYFSEDVIPTAFLQKDKEEKKAYISRIGRALARYRDRCFGEQNLCLKWGEKRTTQNRSWVVEPIPDGQQSGFSPHRVPYHFKK